MNIVLIFGWFGIAIGAALILIGAWAISAELRFRARWKWGDAHKLKQSVRLGWNTGPPPEGVRVLVREHADHMLNKPVRDGWAVMIRRGDKCHTLDGGLVAPITNITGWLEITM